MQKLKPGEMANFLREKCHRHNLKVTPQRQAIFEALYESRIHPTADQIYNIVRKQYPSVSFDTVNRTLLTFASMGLIDVIEGYGNSRHFDPNLNPHHHAHCVKCGDILDFYSKDLDQLEIPEEIHREFKILNKKVVVSGLCRKCQKK